MFVPVGSKDLPPLTKGDKTISLYSTHNFSTLTNISLCFNALEVALRVCSSK